MERGASRKPLVGFRDAPLLFAIFLDMVGFGMVIPDVQTRLEDFGAGGGVIGLVLSSYFLAQIVASPLWGRYSDRVGRKPVLVVCSVLSALSLLLYAFADSILLTCASRVLAGLAAANIVVAQAYLADRTPLKEERVAAMGRVGAAMTAGLLLGPAIGGWLAGMGGNLLLGLVAASASGIGAIWIAVTLPAVPPTVAEDATDSVVVSPVAGLSLLHEVPRLRPLLILASITFLALACLEGTFGRLIRLRLGLGPPEFGLIFGYESLVSVCVQTVGVAWLASRFQPGSILGIGLLLQGVGLALTPFAPSLAALFGVSTPYAIGTGLTTPTLNSLCSEVTPPERQGEMFGLLQGARSAGFLIGPTLGGMLFDWRPEAPYLTAGLVLLLTAIGAIILLKSGTPTGNLNDA